MDAAVVGGSAFRRLLIDASGNAQRAEFGIDKLYPPEAGGRRLGLVEMRV
jgi:uncharacterized protein (DUF2126 family)